MKTRSTVSAVYIISNSLYTEMSKTIYDMCDLPELPQLTEENLQSVTVEGAASTLLRPIDKETSTDEETGRQPVQRRQGPDRGGRRQERPGLRLPRRALRGNGQSPVDLSVFPVCQGVLDVIYNPRPVSASSTMQMCYGRTCLPWWSSARSR